MNFKLSTTQNQLALIMYTNLNSETERMSFSTRLKERMLAQGIKAVDIATRLGISKGTVSQWVNGIAMPSGKNASLLAQQLRCNHTWLMQGKGDPDKAVELQLGPDIRGRVPLISWIQAGNWLEMDSSKLAEPTQYYSHTANVGDRAFALRVMGDSMTSFTGGKSIPEGSVVIVDPDLAAEHGKVVVARLDDNAEATLKQLVIDGGQKYLKPFNHNYPMMPINGNCTIIGVVKQVILDF